MFLITFSILSTSSRSFLAAAYYGGTSLYPTRIKLSHFGLIDSTAKGRRTENKKKEPIETRRNLFTDLSAFQRLCVSHRGRAKFEKKRRKISPQDMIMIQLIFMMAAD